MRRITIVYDGTLYTYKWIKALYWFKKQFHKEGVCVEFINWKSFFPISSFAKGQIDTVLSTLDSHTFDVIVVAFHYSISNFANQKGLSKIELLKLFKERCQKLVWLDTADSTGNCLFEVMPYVDIYLKKQILRDISLYSENLYGTKYFIDYYHKKLGIEDKQLEVDYTPLEPKYYNKLKLSWNIGLSDFWGKSYFCYFRPGSIPIPKMTDVYKYRKTNMFFNGTLKYSPLSEYQRRITIEKMSGDKRICEPSPVMKMSHEQYVHYMKDSKTAISPFGWGEICYRDFEAFVYGATLVKPDMSQISTFPEFFIKGETYVSIDWDFTNFETIIDGIGSKEYKAIAQKGQDLYNYYLNSIDGKKEIVKHIVSVLL